MRFGADHKWNAFEWYSKYPELLQAAGSLPFPYRPGMSLPLGTFGNGKPETTQLYPIPGVLAIHWHPSVGQSASQTDPASIVAKEIYAKVRQAFSGSLDADPPDFVIYMMALDSIFSYLAFLKRVYRCVTAYSEQNYLVPNYYLYAMGFNDAQIQDLRKNKVLLWQRINELILMSRKFRCPAVMDVFNRHHWMNEHVYMDTNSMNAQTYIFVQDTYFQFEMLATPAGPKAGGLTPIPLMDNISDSATDSLFEFGRELIDVLAGSDDAYTISGYLQRAYDGVPSFAVEELRADEVIVPQYDETVLLQIQNARSIPYGAAVASGVVTNQITQDPSKNTILSNPQITVGKETANLTRWDRVNNIIGIRSHTPTLVDIVEASRLQSALTLSESGNDTLSFNIQCATEFVQAFVLWRGSPGNTDLTVSKKLGSIEAASSAGHLAFQVELTAWDWHPYIVSLVSYDGTTAPRAVVNGDLMNTTVLDASTLTNLNRVCLYSEFNAFTQ